MIIPPFRVSSAWAMDAVGRGVNRMAGEAEHLAEPVDGGGRILVTQGGHDG